VVSTIDTHDCILDFLDRSRYSFFQIADAALNLTDITFSFFLFFFKEFAHFLVFQGKHKLTFRQLDLFPSSDEWWGTLSYSSSNF
jgi:hypothetical protein